MFQVRKILVPVDFSEHSEHALDYAVWLGAKLGASVAVAHVLGVQIYAAPPMLPMPVALPVAEFRKHAEDALQRLVDRAKPSGLAVESALLEGTPHREINAFAKQCGADMIVMGTHGRSGIERTLLGSVAERIVRTADVPVVTVHKKD